MSWRITRLRAVGAVLAACVLVAGFAVSFQWVRGAQPAPKSTPQSHVPSGSGEDLTPTANFTPGTTTTTTPATQPSQSSPTPSSLPPKATAAPQADYVRVTQNQDVRPTCLDTEVPYTVVLLNPGPIDVTWQITFPLFGGKVPYWGQATPSQGTIAAGQSSSFELNPVAPIPCSGNSYQASIYVHSSVGSQPTILLTYAGTGPAPYSKVVLVSGSLTLTQACPASGTAPPPFTFAITNTGNSPAYPYSDIKDTITPTSPTIWADASYTQDQNPPKATWLYPGETWTYTVSPRAGVLCDGTVYHVFLYVNNAQGTTDPR